MKPLGEMSYPLWQYVSMFYFLWRSNWPLYKMLLGVSHSLMKESNLVWDEHELFGCLMQGSVCHKIQVLLLEVRWIPCLLQSYLEHRDSFWRMWEPYSEVLKPHLEENHTLRRTYTFVAVRKQHQSGGVCEIFHPCKCRERADKSLKWR